MTGNGISIQVETESLEALAWELRDIADGLDAWVSSMRARVHAPEYDQQLHVLTHRVGDVARAVRQDAETIARIAVSYLNHDRAAQVAFAVAWATGVSPEVRGALSAWGLTTSGPLVGVAVWAATAATAAWAFSSPTTRSVASFRALASLMGLAATTGPRRDPQSQPGPTATLAGGVSAILAPSSSSRGVRVVRSESFTCRPPRGFDDLVSRIPQPGPRDAQVRIDRVGKTTFLYIGGTVDGNVNGGTQPWDMASNIQALAGDTSDSERAARQALASSGASSSQRIVLVGHSQGGLIAQRLAADPSLRVTDVITVGAPVQAGGIPAHVRVTTIENASDPIPALGGIPDGSARDVSVRRVGGIPAGGDGLAAHHLNRYRETARAMDASPDSTLNAVRDGLVRDAGSTCAATLWRGQRAPVPTP